MIRLKIKLCGHYAGKTCSFAVAPKVQFVDGIAELVGSPADVVGLQRCLERNFQAKPVDPAQLRAILKTKEMEGIYGKYYDQEGADEVNDHEDVPSEPSGQNGEEAAEEDADDVPVDDDSEEAEAEHGSEGSGHEDSGVPVSEESAKEIDNLLDAIDSLDPHNDDHWTRAGKPSVEAVSRAANRSDVTRREIEAVVDNYNRETALEEAKGEDEE